MNSSGSKSGGEFRVFRALVLIGLLALLPACGGGGGGGDVAPDTPQTNLNYIFGPPRAGVGPLTVTGSQSRFLLAQSTDGPWMKGTFDTATLAATITDNVSVPILWPDTTTPTGGALFGNLAIVVSQTFRWNGANDPTEGELLITSRNGFFPGTIKMRVLAGGAGVRAEYDSGNDGTYEAGTSYSWGDFYDLWENDANLLYQRISSFVYYMRQGVFSLIDLTMQTAYVIEDNRTALVAAGSGHAVRVGCDPLVGAPDQPGYYDIVWTDVNNNGVIDSVSPQYDTVTITLNQCWVDDPSDPEDLLLDGAIGFTYYESHVQWGAVFTDLVLTQTLSGNVDPGSAKTINGGFSFLIPGF